MSRTMFRHVAYPAPGSCRAAALALMFAVTAAATAQPAPPTEASSAPAVADPKEPIAIVDGKPVTAEEITSFSALIAASERRPDSDPKTDLEDYILTRLHQDVYTTVPYADAALESVPTAYKHPAQRSLLQQRIRERLEKTVTATRPEMEQWYQENLQQFVRPEAVSAHHLFMEVSGEEPTSSSARVLQRIEQVKREADAGTSFALLAKRYSEAASGAAQGGFIGEVTRGRPFGPQGKPINPRLEEALFKLKPGEVSDVIETSHGLHLLYAADRTTTVTPTIDDLITSEILPGSLLRQKIPQKRRELLDAIIANHGGRVVIPETTATEGLTTSTPAVEFDGKTITVHDLEKIYDLAFTRAFARAKQDPQDLQMLFKQVLDLEAEMQAAIDEGIDRQPEVARDLQLLEQRAQAQKHLQAVFTGADKTITEEMQQRKYEEIKESLRRPEAEGWVLLLQSEPQGTTSTPSMLQKSKEKLDERAKALVARLKAGEEFEKVLQEVASEDEFSTGGRVERHALNSGGGGDFGRPFDMAASHATAEGEVVGPLSFGNGWVIAGIAKRYPGEPTPFETVRQRIVGEFQQERQRQLREEILRQLEQSGKVQYLPGAARSRTAPETAPQAAQTTATAQ